MVKIPRKGVTRKRRAEIQAWLDYRADIRLIAETLKRSIPEGTIIIEDGNVSIGGGKKAHAKYLERTGKD